MGQQVFLGGACGATTWRKDVAIPILEGAGVTYHNPQLAPGEWTAAHEALDMRAKTEADVQLFVISGATRGVAGIAEVSYLLAAGRPLALVVEDVAADAVFDGLVVGKAERDDLNRGRLFVRTMAAQQGVPVFAEVTDAAMHAVRLANAARPCATIDQVLGVLADVRSGQHEFVTEEVGEGFHLFLRHVTADADTQMPRSQTGRRWFIPRGATRDEIVRTAFKAVATWAEHEAREHFTYQAARVFGPHIDIARLIAATRDAGN